jgi:hypothetical protein
MTRSLDQPIVLRAAESVQTTPMATLAKRGDGSFAIYAHRSNDSDDDDGGDNYEEQQRAKLQQRARLQTQQQHGSGDHGDIAPFASLHSTSPSSFRKLHGSSSTLATAKDSELVQHIRELRRALAQDLEMEHGIREHHNAKSQRGISSGGHPLDREAREHGVDFDILRDLRAAFRVYHHHNVSGGSNHGAGSSSSGAGAPISTGTHVPNADAIEGIPEADFIRIFGGAIGGFTSDEVLRAWCRQMDSRCAGVLSWRDLSTYLVKSSTNNTWLTRHAHHHSHNSGKVNNDSLSNNNNNNNNTGSGNFLGGSGSSFGNGSNNKSFSGAFAVNNEDTLMEWQRDLCGDRQLEGRSVQSKGHNTVITHLLALPSVNTLISASNDGSLRRWDHWSLEGDAKPMHVCNEWITGLTKVTGMNRIGVLHADRSIFFYDLHMPSKSNSGRQQGPSVVVDYYRGFAQSSNVFIQTLTQPAVGQKAVGSSMIRKRAPGEMPSRPPLPVTLIAPKVAPATAFCHIQSTPVVETVMLGNGDGSLEMMGLRIAETYESVIQPLFELPAVHRGRIAQVTYAPELDSAITAGSTDGVIIVTNLEHLVTTQSMHSDIDHRSAKTIQQFDYRPEYHHMLVHGYGRNIFIWNALTGMRNHSISDIDHVVLQCSLNPDRHRLYALTDDKTIKVYDVRTWKYLDSVSDDKALRVPVNQFEAMIFSEATSMVVTGASNLVAWRTDEAQKMLEDSNAPPAAGAGAGIMSPTHRMMLKSGGGGGRSGKKKKPLAKQDPIHTLLCLLPQCQIVTVDTDNVVQVWSTLSTRRLIKWKWPYPSSIMCAAVAHKGRQLIVGADDGSVRSVSIGTGALCWSLDHPCGHGAGFEVSSCFLAHHAPIPNHSLLFAAVSRHIAAWLFDEESPINPSSSIALRTLPSWRILQLPADYGIVHSFCSSGPDGLCYLAASNSGHVVGFNLHVQMLYVIPPPCQIAAEVLHRLSAKVTAVSYSDGRLLLLRGDAGGFQINLYPPFRATYAEGHTITSIATARIVQQEPPIDYTLHHHHAQRQRAATADRGDAHLIAVGDSSGHITLFVVGDVPHTPVQVTSSRSTVKHAAGTQSSAAKSEALSRRQKTSAISEADVVSQVTSFASTASSAVPSSPGWEYRVRPVWAWQAHDDAAVSGVHFFDPDASHSTGDISDRRKRDRRGEEERVELPIPVSQTCQAAVTASTAFQATRSASLATVALVSSCVDGSLVEWSILWRHDPRTTQQQQVAAPGQLTGDSYRPLKMGALQEPSSRRSRPGIVFESDMGVATLDSSSSSSSTSSGSSDDDDHHARGGQSESEGVSIPSVKEVVSVTNETALASSLTTPQRKHSLRRTASNAAAHQLPPLVDIFFVVDVKRSSEFGQTAKAFTAPSALIPSPSMMSQKLALPPIAMSPSRHAGAGPTGIGSTVNFVVNVEPEGATSIFGDRELVSPLGLDHNGSTPPFSLVSPLARKSSSVMQSSLYRRSPPQRSVSMGGTSPKQNSPTTSPVDDVAIVRNVVQKHAFIRLSEHLQQVRGDGGSGGLVELTSCSNTAFEESATYGGIGNKSHVGLQRRLSKRFLTFSNLLDAADRAALFEGTPQEPDTSSMEQSVSPRGGLGATVGVGGHDGGPTASNDGSSFRKAVGGSFLGASVLSPAQQQRRGSSFHQMSQQPSLRGGSGSILSPTSAMISPHGSCEGSLPTSNATSPSSGAKKRFATRYSTSTATSPVSPLARGSEAHTLMLSELQRPLSRVSALRRIHGKEDDEQDGGAHDGSAAPVVIAPSTSVVMSNKSSPSTVPSNRPSQSVERRLASVHRRREDREEAEFVHGFQPYFGRVALQLFDGEREQLEKNKEH